MNRGDVRLLTRLLLDDLNSSIVSDPALNMMIECGIYKVAGMIRRLRDDYFVSAHDFTCSGGLGRYSLATIAPAAAGERVRMIEENLTPTYPRLIRVDWLTHKLQHQERRRPKHYAELNGRISLIPVPDTAYPYTVYCEQAIVLPANDSAPIPLIPAPYHDLVSIWAGIMATRSLAHYQSLSAVSDLLASMWKERANDVSMELAGKRWDDVEVAPGAVGADTKAAE